MSSGTLNGYRLCIISRFQIGPSTGSNQAFARSVQVSLPVATVDGSPIGLGIIGPRGSDEALLDLAADAMQLFTRDN